jgi:hypothetical protein
MEAGAIENETLVKTPGGSWRRIRDAVRSHGLGLFTTYIYQVDEYGEPDPERVLIGEDIPVRNLLANIFHLLDDNRCSTFVSDLINVARQLTGKTVYIRSERASPCGRQSRKRRVFLRFWR